MALFTIDKVRIAGISVTVPKNEISNHDYKWISKKDREQLIKTTGVITKRVAPEGMTVSDLCVNATQKLLPELGWDPQEIDLLIFISQSRDYLIPGTSHILQDRLGMKKSTIAFDVSLGCSAYVYGLSIIQGMMSSAGISKALLMMGDTSSFGSYRDKSSYPLFGDAGTVTALEFSEDTGNTWFNLQTDGSGYDAIIIPGGGSRKFPDKRSLDYKCYGKGIWRNDLQPSLDGIKVFNFSLREVPPSIKNTLKFAGKELADVDYFVLHQANKLINETLRKLLKVEEERWPYSIHKYANTSSASIPVTIVSELRERAAKEKLTLMLTGFGVGLSWGSVLIETNKLIIPEIQEM